MSEPIPGLATGLSKRKLPSEESNEQERCSREPKRLRLCLRTVVEALSKWRMHKEDVVFFEDSDLKRAGGSADIVKATVSGRRTVNQGSQRSVEIVAAKKFRFGKGINKRTQSASFANELNLLSELYHDNLVELIGFVENAEEGVAWILLRWEDNGNLREFIHSQDWVIPERLSLIHDVACGVGYLHSRDPPICHGDLKSLNVLVTSRNRAIITDLGSARKLESHTMRRKEGSVAPPTKPTTGPAQESELTLVKIEDCGTFITLTGPFYTLRWAAPELLKDEPFSLASDIWAVAWICWETMTGKLPFDDIYKESQIVLSVTKGDLPTVANNKEISQVRALCAMMTRCWAQDPDTRPVARDFEKSIGLMDRITPTRRDAAEAKGYSAELLCTLGYTHYEDQNYQAAEEYFERALEIARVAGNDLDVAHAMIGRGTVFRATKKYSQAVVAYGESKKIYARFGAKKQGADAIWGLGHSYRSLEKYSKAEAAFMKAKEIYTQIDGEKDVADAILGLGEVYNCWNKASKAEAFYTEAKELYAHLGAERDVADAVWGLGEIYRSQHKYSQAEASYSEAKEIYTRLGAEEDLADATWGLGEVYLQSMEYSKAETSFIEAKEIYARFETSKKLADAFLGLGHVYCCQNRYSEALVSYNKAKAEYEVDGHEEDVADVLVGLGDIYASLEKYLEAEVSYTEAKEIYEHIGNEDEVAECTWKLGGVYRRQREHGKAAATYTEAKEIYNRIGDEHRVAECASELGEVYDTQMEYSKAAAAYTEAKEISERIGDEYDVACSVTRLGKVYGHQREYSKAAATYTEAMEIYEGIGEEDYYASTAWELGEIYRLQEEYSKAAAAYTEAKEIFSRRGFRHGAKGVAWWLEWVNRRLDDDFDDSIDESSEEDMEHYRKMAEDWWRQ